VVRESFSSCRRADGGAPETPPGDRPLLDWAGDAGRRWSEVADRVESQIAPVSDVLFEAAALRSGERVLDVGCGRGSTTRRAAEVVGPTGRVAGVDIAVGLIDEARTLPAPEGAPIEWIAADAQTEALPQGEFDAVISRFGTLFFDDPVAAFGNLAVSSRPGGRLCVAAWQRRDRSPILQDALDIVSAVAASQRHPIDVGRPDEGPFAFGNAAYVRPILEEAGWVDVDVTGHEIEMLLFGPGTVDEAVDAGLTFGPVEVALREAPAFTVDTVRAALAEHLRPRHDGTGVRMTGAIAVVCAVRR
jgi:SAM-dependent methyltransferase